MLSLTKHLSKVLRYLYLVLLCCIPAFAEEIDFLEQGASLEATDTPNTWILFFGRFHPLIVHIPIGVLVAIAVLETMVLVLKKEIPESIRKSLAIVATVSAALSVLIGEFLATGGDYDAELLEQHELTGKLLGILCALMTVVAYLIARKAIWLKVYYGLLIASIIMLAVVGHYGGSLTHGTSYLSEYWPFKAQKEVRNIQSLQDARVFEDLMLPIFEKKCLQCHNAQKIKGDLRMDAYDLLMKGGESGKVIVPGNPDESELLKLVLLDRKEERAMPPEGKPGLTADEVKILRWWIQTGAADTTSVAALKPEGDLEQLLTQLLVPGARYVPLYYTLTAKPVDEKVLKNLQSNHILVLPISKKKTDLVQVSFLNTCNVSDTTIDLLKPIAENVTWLDLSNATLTGNVVTKLTSFKNLTKLYIQQTNLTDADIKAIEKLINLEYLNVYSTALTDASIASLQKLKNLRKLFIWNTKITDAGITTLKTVLPKLQIVTGAQPSKIIDTSAAKSNKKMQ